MSLALLGDALLYAVLPAYAKDFGLTLPWVGIMLSANRFVRVFAYGILARLTQTVGVRRMCIVATITATATTAMYGLGQGVRQDSGKMFKLLLEAAETGYHFAQLRVADIYLNPRSVPPKMARDMKLPDPVQALEYLQLAADQGSTEAQRKISDIHSDTGKFSNPKIKFKLIQHAANGGDAATSPPTVTTTTC